MILCDNCTNKDICRYVRICEEVNEHCQNTANYIKSIYNVQFIYNCKRFKSSDIEDEE